MFIWLLSRVYLVFIWFKLFVRNGSLIRFVYYRPNITELLAFV